MHDNVFIVQGDYIEMLILRYELINKNNIVHVITIYKTINEN